MASCWSGCWGSLTDELRKLRRPIHMRGRTYKRARYNEKRVTIEFENLIEDEDFEPAPRRLLTEAETELIKQRRYDQLVEQQKKLDVEIDARLKKQEDDLKMEEEAFYEAKREASRVARQAKQVEDVRVPPSKNRNVTKGMDDVSLSSWISDDGISLTSSNLDEEDFDSFLEKVKARSLSSNTKSAVNGVATLSTDEAWETAVAQSAEAARNAGKSLNALPTLSPTEDRATDVDR